MDKDFRTEQKKPGSIVRMIEQAETETGKKKRRQRLDIIVDVGYNAPRRCPQELKLRGFPG